MVFMFLKLIFLIRNLENFTIYADASTKRICRDYGISGNVRFALKCHFYQNPERTFLWVAVLSTAFLAYILRVFELPYLKANKVDDQRSSAGYVNAIWLTLITITTVGYGDIYP